MNISKIIRQIWHRLRVLEQADKRTGVGPREERFSDGDIREIRRKIREQEGSEKRLRMRRRLGATG